MKRSKLHLSTSVTHRKKTADIDISLHCDTYSYRVAKLRVLPPPQVAIDELNLILPSR